jgi:4-amino-4-deoxy-L-arabinose transferase-like glycosyltransferase
LEKNASRYTWVAAAVGANNAAGYQLATDDPVMAIGGFNGTDPAPTLRQFQDDVRAGKVHYFIASGGTGVANGGSSDAQQITTWVESHFKSTSVGGVTLYDLTTSSSSSLSS